MCVYILLYFSIWNNVQVGFWVYVAFSPHTHTHTFCSLHERGPILGSKLLRIRGDCVVVPQWMYFPSDHCENPS